MVQDVHQEILLTKPSLYENFILADEPFAKALQILEICVSVNNNLCGKFVSTLDSPTTFDERFEVTRVTLTLFFSDFNLLSCGLDNLTFKMLFLFVLYSIKTKFPYFHSSFRKIQIVSFASSITKNITVFPS